MSTTGDLYLQVYNKSTNKFQELETGIVPISVVGIPYISGGEFFSFTGIYIPEFLTDNVICYPVNIGKSNLSPVGKGNESIQIGRNNSVYTSTGILPSGIYISQPLINIGNENINSGIENINIGHSNNIDFGYYVYNLGTSNFVKKSINNYIFGTQNYISGAFELNVIGKTNNLKKSSNLNNNEIDLLYSTIIGNNNYSISGLSFGYILGNNNTFNKNRQINLFGNSNILTQNGNLYIVGNSNILDNSYFIDIYGTANDLLNSSGSFLVGLYNLEQNGKLNKLLGQGNSTIDSIQNNVFGDSNNVISGIGNKVYGNNNIFFNLSSGVSNQINSINNIIFGNSNSLFNSNNNNYFGTNNILFTGQNNFIVGINNQISGDTSSFYFGEDNLGINNDISYTFGEENFVSGSNNGFTFGSNNTNLGFQNYVFGNNNIVRSGDYNSILIGISHEFTGDFKVASVNIASVDSKIEVSPADIKLSSSNRAKFNNENITVASDLNNYLNSSNGLSNSGVFTSYIINDPSYSNLSTQIELQSFAYSGKEDRYYGGFSGFNVSDPNAYNFTGFFRKQPSLYYNGLHNIDGDYYYQSNNEAFEALFSRDIEPITGNWIISPRNSLGILFCNESTNTGVFPVSNWIRTGSSTFLAQVSGYVPAPSFTYSPTFTGFFEKQKINSTNNYASNYFNNFGTVAYPSESGNDIAVIYGNHANPQFDPAWLIIDKYSSGVYYINNAIASNVTPQTGWVATGYMGYTGRNPLDLNNAIVNTGIKISLGTRSGIISSYDPTYGKIYIPFFY